MTSSSTNVLIVNALVGMTKADPAWPHPLYSLGFEVKWLEHAIKTSEGEEVRPDMIIVSPQVKHALVVEGKSGGANKKQLDNYSTLTSADVQIKGFASEADSHDITIVGVDRNAASIERTIISSGKKFPVIILRDGCIEKTLNSFCNQALDDIFKDPIPLCLEEAPKGYIKFDEHSEQSEIAPHVIVALVGAARKDQNHLSTNKLTELAFGPLWDIYNNPKAKTTMTKNVQKILEDASKHELKEILKKEQLGESGADAARTHWQLIIAKNEESPSHRLVGLMTKANKFIARIKGDEKQLSFFDALNTD